MTQVQMMQDQLRKRMRFAYLMLALGIMIGFILGAVVAMPPVWLGAM